MKILKVFWILLTALCLIGCSIIALYCFFSSDRILNFITSNYLQTLKIDSGYSVTYDSLSTDRLNCLDITGLHVLKEQKTIISLDELKVSTSFIDFIRLFLGSDDVSFVFECDNLFADLYIESNSGSDNLKSDDEFLSSLVENLNGSIRISNSNVSISFQNSVFSAKNINLSADFKRNYAFDLIDIQFDELEFTSLDLIIKCFDLSLSVNKLQTCKLIASSITSNDFCLEDINISLQYRNDTIESLINLSTFTYSSDDNRIFSEDLELGLNLNFSTKELNVYSDSLQIITNLYDLNYINLEDFSSGITYNNETNINQIDIRARINGNHNNSNIGTFSFGVVAATNINSFEELFNTGNYNGFEINIYDLNCASFAESNNIYVTSEDLSNFNSTFQISNKISGNIAYSFDTHDSNIRLYVSSFKFSEYKVLFDLIEDYAGEFFNEDTQIDGSFVYKGKLDINDLNGRFSINLVGQNFILANQKQTVAVSFEALAENNFLSIDTLAVSALGKRVSYSGSINLDNLFPEGILVLQDSNTFDNLLKVSFNLDDDKLGYTFSIGIPVVNNISADGHVNFSDRNYIIANTVLKTENYDYSFDFNFDVQNMILKTHNDNSDIEISYFDKNISIIGSLDSVPIILSDSTNLGISSVIDARIDLSTMSFLCSFKDSYLYVSDILNVIFDLDIDSTHSVLSNLTVDFKDTVYDFDGKLSLLYKDIQDVFNLKTGQFDIISDLNIKESNNYLKGSFTDSVYSLDLNIDLEKNLSVKMLGDLNSGFYADCSFGDLNFVVKYIDGIISVDNADGRFNSLSLKDINFNLDFKERNVFCSFSFVNDLVNYDSVLQQGGTIQINAKLDSLVVEALNIAGIDVDASFELTILDAYLGDGFNLKDTSLDVTFSRSNVRFNGNLINGYILPQERYLDICVDKDLLVGFNVKGYYDNKFELYLSDIYFPLQLIDQFINTPFYSTFGGIIQGELLVNGSPSDPSFYGMLYSQAFNMGLLFIPNQNLSLKNVVISAVDHSFYISRIPVVGHSSIDGRYYNGNVSVELKLGDLCLDSMDLYLDVFEDPIDLWIPLTLDDSNDLNIRGDVVGTLHFYYKNHIVGVDSVITADNTNVTFNIEDKPEWMDDTDDEAVVCTNVILTSGKNVEFYYPNKNNAFINFTVEEGDTVQILYDVDTNEVSALGSFNIKSGRFSYINNDFVITDGNCEFSKDLNGDFVFNIDLSANMREYDYEGNRMDIYLTLNNADLNNINPRLSSNPNLSENEILQVLASSVLPSSYENVTLSNIANVAAVAARAASSLGILENYKDYSLNNVVRSSLNLDIFNAKSLILENIIINGLSYKENNVSLLAKYLNGTSLFAGKFFGDNWFARMTILLRSASSYKNNNNYGHFLASDLNIDFEFSLEFDNPFGEFAIFTKPQELSIFDFLDTIGFSITKRISL